jgi:reductive dehalogenase
MFSTLLVATGVAGLLGLLIGLIALRARARRPLPDDDTPTTRIDERTIMFARQRLTPGTERFDAYYRQHPDHKTLDDHFRSKPGLLAKTALHYHPYLFAAAEASFTAVAAFHALLDSPPAAEPVPVDAASISRFILHWGRTLGAVSVGITTVRDYHLYSHLGRNEPYGAPVQLDHRFAIALSVEMDKSLLDHAPDAPTVLESARQYLNAGAIAIQIALLIQNLGYAARAHIDGNYQVICPLVARDAGLGELGRMGLLMTPSLGPRVRLAVITTDLPLIVSPRRRDPSVLDFCTHCQKCAHVCPSRAIPFGDQAEINGVKRWQINSEACFTYGCAIGTDCGRCVRACPYSHPNNWLHNLVRAGVRRSALFRRVANGLDDVIYGRRPDPAPLQAWMEPGLSASKKQE